MIYLVGAAYVVLYVAGGWFLQGHPLALSLFSNAGLLLPPAIFLGIVGRRRLEWAGCQRLFWETFAFGVAFWTIGHVGAAVNSLHGSTTSWSGWYTVFTVCGSLGPLVALLVRPHVGPRRDAAGPAGLLLASYGLLGVFLYAYFVFVPSLVVTAHEADATLLTLVEANRVLLAGGALLALCGGWRTAWRGAYGYVAAGSTIALILPLAGGLNVTGPFATTLSGIAWLASYLFYAKAALAAPPSPSAADGVDLPSHLVNGVVSAIPVALIPLVGYTVVHLQPLPETADLFRALLTSVMTVAGLGILTLRLAEQGGELQRADSRMRLLAAATEQTGDLILITRADGRFVLANDAFVRALGYSREELAHLGFRDLVEKGADALGGLITREVRERGVWRGTLVRRRRDGTTFPASCTVTPLKEASGTVTHYVGVERDITDELRMREQLVHSERLSAIGELVAGVAHEINNPLQTIVGSVELMIEQDPHAIDRQDLEIVRREAGRAGQIVRNLLSFVRRITTDRANTDLNDVVRTMAELRRYHLRQRSIAVDLELAPAGVPALVNRDEIQQVVLNLLLNAEQAILSAASHGRITIRTYATARERVVEVEDSGPGISAELGGRIFEPFFTTKDVGQGTGLGLSISHGIAMSHGGTLDLVPSSGGACFRLALPVHEEPVVSV